MRLKDWLKKQKLSQAAFAKKIKSSQGHISELASGKMRPTLETVGMIAKATKGAVSVNDWLLGAK